MRQGAGFITHCAPARLWGVATAIWQYLQLDRGWWIAVSAVVVIQPDRGATMAETLQK
jgi:uncharacterized membrane protein YccC